MSTALGGPDEVVRDTRGVFRQRTAAPGDGSDGSSGSDGDHAGSSCGGLATAAVAATASGATCHF